MCEIVSFRLPNPYYLLLAGVGTYSVSLPELTLSTLSSASTRNFFDVDTGSTKEVGVLPSALSILDINSCPRELGIYVHGWRATEEDAEEQTQRVFLSLQKSGYIIPLIGFSWDSNTVFSPDG
jgi:hypothetical protein